MNSENVKGFRDIEDSSKKIKIRKIFEDTFSLYGFIPVETPIIEYEEFVKGNNPNDEAVSSIFKLKDRGDRNLALRYELTFQLKRLSQNKKLPYKRFEIGPVFRDEPVGQNRWRQFSQCDADIIGSTVKDEAEILKMASEILKKLNIKFTINFNNKKLLNEIIESLNTKKEDKDAIIREIDKLDKFSEKEVKDNLKKYKAEKIMEILKKPKDFFEKYKSFGEIKELEKICSYYKIKLNFVSYLSRGLSYYNGTIFEIKGELKETITAGGSYPINGIQSTGISFGLDRLELIAKLPKENKKIIIISLGEDKKSVEIADKLRNQNIPCQIFYGKPGKALDYANSYLIPFVIFVGDEEVKKKKFKLKNMNTGKEKLISEKDLEKELRKIN